jgi:hypothetical protein
MLSQELSTGGMALLITGLAFVPTIRREIFKRDKGECQNPKCFGNYIQGYPLAFREGWHVNMAHFPDKHIPRPDTDMNNGRCLCMHCHIIEEIERGNHRGATLLYERQTIRNTHFLKENNWADHKPPIQFYYDWVDTDEPGKEGLAQVYAERFAINLPLEVFNEV